MLPYNARTPNKKTSIPLIFLRGALIPLFLSSYVAIGYCNDNADAVMDRVISTAIEKKLYESSMWKSLLEMTDEKLNIEDPNFILSRDDFSLKNELVKTIQSFFIAPQDSLQHPICRFPARFLWIKTELGLEDSIFPSVSCPDFEEFKNRAPAQEIYLVFVSEDVSQPSSMMGHVFFKMCGRDYNSAYVEHAVSFYTVIEPKDTPLLIVKSTMTGMKGFFSLLPYDVQVKRYLETENRNVWEYKLNLTEKDKMLLQYHIWELKGLKMNYLFTGYNCATVVYNILSLSSENFIKQDNLLWVTPKDVVKNAYQNNLIINAELIPSDNWYIRMLSEELDSQGANNIFCFFKKKLHLPLS